MKPERIQGKRNISAWRLGTFVLLVALTGFASGAGATFSPPAARSITWQGNVGVLNDIPARTTIYTTLNPSGGNDSSAMQTAINNCPAGQVVKLSAGTFNVGNAITLKSSVTLRGAGMGATTLKGASGMTGAYFIGLYGSVSLGTSIGISGGLAKGSTSITTSSPHGWSVGDIIVIDQLNNPSGDPVVNNVGNNGTCTWCGRASGTRSLGQVAKVIAVPTSTTATLEIPLYWNYSASLTPQGTKMSGITSNAGVEDLTIDNSLSGTSNQQDDGTIFFRGTSNCWLLRVEASGSYGKAVEVFGSYRNTFRKCKFHEGVPATPTNGSQYGTDRAYGFNFDAYNSANLIEDSQFYHLRLPIALVGESSGNVIAYNYMTDLYSDTTAGTFQLAGITTHGAHPMMNLMEGNYIVARLRADNVWGSSSHNTYFRNRAVLMPNRPDGTWNCDLHSQQRYYNFVGNILGTLGVETTYILNNVTLSGQEATFRFGYFSDGATTTTSSDPAAYSTALLHGNWDSATNSVVWNSSYDSVLPSSLYLAAKPSWWGSLQWPAIGPDISPMSPAATAAGSGTPWDSTLVLSPPSNVKAQ